MTRDLVKIQKAFETKIGRSDWKLIRRRELFQKRGWCAFYNPYNLGTVYFPSLFRSLIPQLEKLRNFESFQKLHDVLCREYPDNSQSISFWTLLLDLLENGFLMKKNFDENEEIREIKRNYKIKREAGHLLILTSMECNYRCRYCYFGGDNGKETKKEVLSFDAARKGIDCFFKHMNSSSGTVKMVRFLGGEPLLHYDLIDQILKYISQKKRDSRWRDLQFAYSIITNGSLLDKRWVKLFKKYRFDVCVSLDGRREINDKMRFTKDEQGGFDAAVKGIKLLNRYHLKPVIAMVVGSHNIGSLAEEARWLYRNLKIGSVSFNPMAHAKNDKLPAIGTDAVLKGLDVAYGKMLKWDLAEREIVSRWSCFSQKGYSGNLCAAAQSQMAIFPDGCIGPCPRYAKNNKEKEDISGADIINGRLWRRWMSYNRFSNPQCFL